MSRRKDDGIGLWIALAVFLVAFAVAAVVYYQRRSPAFSGPPPLTRTLAPSTAPAGARSYDGDIGFIPARKRSKGPFPTRKGKDVPPPSPVQD